MSFMVYLRSVDTAYGGANTLRSSVAPSSDPDLANKQYVDTTLASAAASGTFWQVPVTEQADAAPSNNAVTGSVFSDGDRVLVGGTVSSASDDFYGHENKIAVKDGSGWNFTSPQEGMAVWVEAGSQNANSHLVYSGSSWVLMSSISGAIPLTKIAISGDNLGSVQKILQTGTGDDAPEAGDILALDSANQIVEATAIPSSLLSDATTSSKGIVQITDADFDIPSSGVIDIKDGLDSGDILRNDAVDLVVNQILSADGTAQRIDAATAAELKAAVGSASTSALGVMSFNSDHFNVASGAVISLIKGGASASEFIESKSSSFSGGEILKFVNSGGVEGIQPASAADVAGAIRDGSSSDKGVASFEGDDFGVSSGDVSLLRRAETSGIETSIPTINTFGDLKEFYCFDLSGETSEQTLQLPALSGASDAIGREVKISVLTLGTGASLKIDAGEFTNDSSDTYDQRMDEFSEISLDQNFQTLRLVCVAQPAGSDAAHKTCWKVA